MSFIYRFLFITSGLNTIHIQKNRSIKYFISVEKLKMSRNDETKNQYQKLFDVKDNKNTEEIKKLKNMDYPNGHFDFNHFYKYIKFLYYFYFDYKDALGITDKNSNNNDDGEDTNQDGNFIEKLWRLIKEYKAIKITDTVKYYSNHYFALLDDEKYGRIRGKLIKVGIFPINVEDKKHKLGLNNKFHNKIYLIKKEDSGKQIQDYCSAENGITFGFFHPGKPIEDAEILDKIKNDAIRGTKLRLSCPIGCDDVTKEWICAECGQFIELLTMGIMIIYCKCGYMKYNARNMVCNHIEHGKRFEENVSFD